MSTNLQLLELAHRLGIRDFDVLVSPDEYHPLKEGQQRIVNIVTTQPIGHWCLASYLNKEYIYFDSFGCSAPYKVLEVCFSGHNYVGCDDEVQNGKSSECGIFSLYVAYRLSRGDEYIDILYDLPYGKINN